MYGFKVPHKPCVYFLYQGATLIYVGKSAALLARIGQHYMSAKFSFDFVRYIEYENEETAFKYERAYIERYKPQYNTKIRYSKHDWRKKK